MGKYSEEKINDQLKNTNFTSDRKQFAFIKLPHEDYLKTMGLIKDFTDPFVEMIHDKFEVTLILEVSLWDSIKELLNPEKVELPLGLITCEVTEENPTGYLLKILEILSPNDIGVYVQGAYTTDNILVHYDDLDIAINLLNSSFK